MVDPSHSDNTDPMVLLKQQVDQLTANLVQTQQQLATYQSAAGVTPENVASFQEKLDKLDQLAETSSSKKRNTLVQQPNQPLKKTLCDTEHPAKFKLPPLLKYNGTTNPRKHLWQFEAWLQMYKGQEEMCTKMFKGTLEGNAEIWYGNLPADSIDSWNELQEIFMDHYIHNTEREKDIWDLQNVRQTYNEPLKKYFARWKTVLSKTRNVLEETAASAFSVGLVKG